MAAVAARVLGTDEAVALEAMRSVSEVEGRFSTICYEGVSARLLLAKNPAGWAELLDLLGESQNPVVIGINSRTADGHDPSWLWDVAFEDLATRLVVATGDRSLDLAVRLKYAGVEHQVIADQGSALIAAGAPAVEYVGNYTAFQQFRRTVSRRPTHPGTSGSHGENHTGVTYSARSVPVAKKSAETSDPGPAGATNRKSESVLRIAIVHPDLLGTYGDGGNGTVLACRAAWRDWPVELILARSDKPLPTADIYCMGGGEDGPQVESAALLRGSALPRALDNGAALLAVCAGFQIVGTGFADAAGHSCEGLGLIDVTTTKGRGNRCVGELIADPEQPMIAGVEQSVFTGFENHSGLTGLGAGARPLGLVRAGVGNGDGSRTEGATCGQVVGTYMHGPVLARNPALADALLSMATGTLPRELDDTEEEALRSERLGAVRAARGSLVSRRTRELARLISPRSV